jgi:hypothetical protein
MTKYIVSVKAMRPISIVLFLVLMIVASHTTILAQASSDDNENDNGNDNGDNNGNNNPFSGALRDFAEGIDESDAGTEAGRDAAREDFYANTNAHENCPREAGAWCFGYNTGYSTVMNQLKSAHR